MSPTFASAGPQTGAHLSDAGVDDGGEGHQGQVRWTPTTTTSAAAAAAAARVKVAGEIHLGGTKVTVTCETTDM